MRAALVLFSLSAGVSLAQVPFEKIYFSAAGYQMNLLELSSGNVLANLAWYPGVSLLGPDGSVQQSACHYGDTIMNMTSVQKWSDNEYYFVAGYRKDSCSTSSNLKIHPLVGKMDSLGNISSLRYYALNDGCGNMPIDLTVTSDNKVITWGGSFFALKVDPTAGTLIWARRFDRKGVIQFIKELPSGDLLAGITLDTAGAVVARLDPDGNFLWCKSYIRPKGVIHDCLIESDNSFIVTGYTDSTSVSMFAPLPSSFHPKLFMMKLDGTGEVQWCKSYESAAANWYTPQWSKIKRSIDGNYVLLATIGHNEAGVNFNFPHRPFLMKTTANGDTLWARCRTVGNFSYHTRDLLTSADGGALFSGIVLGDLPEANSGLPYVLKTDSSGHFPCGEENYPVQLQDLFPTDSSFILTSVDGGTVLPAFANDTVFDPFSVYDGCVIVTTGISPYQSIRYRVHPNPSTGRFTVEFENPLAGESYYSLYDVMGKLLYQRPLPPGAMIQEVDLSRFAKGTYVLKFLDPEGVSYERVVLE